MPSKQLFSHGSVAFVAHSQATLGATGFFEANTCQLTYHPLTTVSAKNVRRNIFKRYFWSLRGLCLLEYKLPNSASLQRRTTLRQLICQLRPKESHMIKKKPTNTVQFLWEGIVPSLNSLFPFPSLAPSSAGNKI